jgi:hypothetical protein
LQENGSEGCNCGKNTERPCAVSVTITTAACSRPVEVRARNPNTIDVYL